MKFKTPRDCAAVSHGGAILPIDADGGIETYEDAASLLAAHGIMPWPAEQPVAIMTMATIRRMSRSNLIVALEGSGYSGPPPMTLAELRKMLFATVAAQTVS